MKGILVAFENGELHALVGPQAVECGEALLRHRILDTDFGVCGDELGVALRDTSQRAMGAAG